MPHSPSQLSLYISQRDSNMLETIYRRGIWHIVYQSIRQIWYTISKEEKKCEKVEKKVFF